MSRAARNHWIAVHGAPPSAADLADEATQRPSHPPTPSLTHAADFLSPSDRRLLDAAPHDWADPEGKW